METFKYAVIFNEKVHLIKGTFLLNNLIYSILSVVIFVSHQNFCLKMVIFIYSCTKRIFIDIPKSKRISFSRRTVDFILVYVL